MPKDGTLLNPKQQLLLEHRKKNERWFETQWKRIGGPEYEPQLEFHPNRKWAFDFGFPNCVPPIAVEMDGGGHKMYWKVYRNDVEKMNAALFLGWQVFRITTDMVRSDDVQFLEMLKEYINDNTRLLSKGDIPGK